jgi:glucose-6-phosphate-specific signal transduction histidine kinase
VRAQTRATALAWGAGAGLRQVRRSRCTLAGPAQAQVTVRYEDGLVTLQITDTGHGPQGARGTGHGLVGMRERAAMFGGQLEAGQADGGGFTVRARLPLTTPVSA